MGWKTITGALTWALGVVTAPAVLAVLPERYAQILQAVGGLLAAIGVRHAIARTTR